MNLSLRKNAENQLVLATLNKETQKQAAQFNQDKTIEVAHLMSSEFIEWLVIEASAGRWSKEDVGAVLCRRNSDNQLILATLDEKTQKHVAAFNKAKTCSVVPYMDEGDFLRWLYEEAEKGEWDQKMVYNALFK